MRARVLIRGRRLARGGAPAWGIVVAFVVASRLCPGAGETAADVDRYTSKCLEASLEWKKPVERKVFEGKRHVTFEGWSGDATSSKLSHRITMRLRFEDDDITGHYWFNHMANRKYALKGACDEKGNLLLLELLPTNNIFFNREFHGKMKDGEIAGSWQWGSGKKCFLFYAKSESKTETPTTKESPSVTLVPETPTPDKSASGK